MKDKSELVIDYHERTKHHPHRYARSPEFLDWENEPDPFRSYEGSPLLSLSLSEKDPDADYHDLYERSGNTFQSFSLKTIATFLELSLGLSAWKSYRGASWALRMNPSSGNLHPTEAHLILPPLPENNDNGGVYHYSPSLHALEQRAVFDAGIWSMIRDHFGTDGFFVGLSSIYWRESWKYGERAFRYCHQDIGHTIACLSFAGNLMGWTITYLNMLSDQDVEIILGFQKTKWRRFEKEHPELLLFVHKTSGGNIPGDVPLEIIEFFQALSYHGEPNQLSQDHKDWHIIDEVASVTVKPRTPALQHLNRQYEFFGHEPISVRAAAVIRQRRSALAFDKKTTLPRRDFLEILDKTIPRSRCAPFDLELGETSVHLLIFVHRISGLDPGLYFFVRDERDFEALKRKSHPDFLWEHIDGTSGSLRLYLLRKGDFQSKGATAGCNQEIAGDGVLSLAMISRFRENIERHPFHYRRLHWEAGMIGQILYLGAEAHGMRGTGMGCFFDDFTHQIAGFPDNTFQDIYHFSVGKAIEDKRLTTLPPYHHLRRGYPNIQ